METTPKTLRVTTIEAILGPKRTKELLLSATATSTIRSITEETLKSAARYTEWLASHGHRPASYSPKQRQIDRVSWQRVAERWLMSATPAQKLMRSYLKDGKKFPSDNKVPCPDCGKPYLLHGLDIHRSRSHGFRGPHFRKGKQGSGARSR